MSDSKKPPVPEVRKGQGDVKLTRAEFDRRLGERFYDPAFDSVRAELERVMDVAWEGYDSYRKSPRMRPAGEGFADPEYELPVEWLETRDNIHKAEARQREEK
nr:NADPH-dependent FMN reductase [Gemmatimonadota bacterium]